MFFLEEHSTPEEREACTCINAEDTKYQRQEFYFTGTTEAHQKSIKITQRNANYIKSYQVHRSCVRNTH